MIYFDSAFIARCYLPEPGHAEVTAFATRGPRIACAEIARIEVTSAFHRKLREGVITAAIHRELCAQFEPHADLPLETAFSLEPAAPPALRDEIVRAWTPGRSRACLYPQRDAS